MLTITAFVLLNRITNQVGKVFDCDASIPTEVGEMKVSVNVFVDGMQCQSPCESEVYVLCGEFQPALEGEIASIRALSLYRIASPADGADMPSTFVSLAAGVQSKKERQITCSYSTYKNERLTARLFVTSIVALLRCCLLRCC